MPTLKVSYILATHNRRDVLANTLARITNRGLNRADFEIIVVDNASTDGTLDVARAGADTVLDLKENYGSCAKAFGVDIARGEYIFFLDDDSYPSCDVDLLAASMKSDPRVGARGCRVYLPDGQIEGAALPNVFVGCGVILRATALREVGGLDRTFFMQAEEYDLCFRLVQAGWVVCASGGTVDHIKSPQARRSDRTTYYDTRNNLRVIYRYLPEWAMEVCKDDCLQRYEWLAESAVHQKAHAKGASEGITLGETERRTFANWRLTPEVFEHFYRWDFIRQQLRRLAEDGLKRIVLADLGKNIFPFVDGARHAGLEILAIADDRFARPGRYYRDIPVIPVREALNLDSIDCFVVSNTADVHANKTYRRLSQQTKVSVRYWAPWYIPGGAIDSTCTSDLADQH